MTFGSDNTTTSLASEAIMQSIARHSFALVSLLALGSIAHAQEQGCIELKAVAETEQEFTNEQGQKAKRLVPAAKVVPGDEVVWTIVAKNICAKPTENIVIANPVPEQMTYIAGSAIGVGTEIHYSLDGKQFAAPTALIVRDADGTARVARSDEYRAVRWTYASSFAPGASAFVRYRAAVK